MAILKTTLLVIVLLALAVGLAAQLGLLRGRTPSDLERIRRICEGMPGAKVAKSDPGYLHVQFETRWMKFVDDTEFWFDPRAGLIHVRSASRMGRNDFGVNRARVEAIRARLEAR